MGAKGYIPDVARIRSDIEALAKMVDDSKPGWTRRPFTPWYAEGRQWLTKRMREAGLDVSLDAASNLIGALPGQDSALPPIMIGSHTDTVTGGGRFDGIIGVIAGIEIARLLKESGHQLRHPLEIVDFTAEEPSEFGISTIGSRGMVGHLDEDMLGRSDSTGLVLRDAMERQGGRMADLADEARKSGEVALYLELHIEQGPVLEQSGCALGAVTGIVGILRYRIIIEGAPNHAGTTPMSLRNDALAGFCEIGLAFEQHCKAHGDGLVGTIGRLTNEPNASNVVPGCVTFDLEIRSLDTALSLSVYEGFFNEAERIAAARGLTLRGEKLSQSEPVRVGSDLLTLVEQSCAAVASVVRLPSGAGHDANQLAAIAPIGMIFVPSRGGRSHCPEEWTDYEQVAMGVDALFHTLLAFDSKGKGVDAHDS
ncbi:Zn-dependent hydrolase [Paenibacillus paeoniae]|uniref:Zn-dependent hydrolase n=2 Tax=Paenibacillus paeoniae TaxID=2292705 RepID=A0A371PQ13_9BACL|nr:Zn-dependent hydrolase [Paenibacillus paeoniae]